jgi:hypothetical protein
MATLPEDDIYESPACTASGGGDREATLRLADLLGGRDFDVRPEPVGGGGSVPARGRDRFSVRRRAPRVAAVTLVVLGAGVSIRLLRRPSVHGGLHSGGTTQRFVPSRVERRDPAWPSTHRRVKRSPRRGAVRRRGSVYGHAGPTKRARIASDGAYRQVERRAKGRVMTPTRQIAGTRNGCEARHRPGQTAHTAKGLRSRPSSALIERSDGTSEVPHTTQSAYDDGLTESAPDGCQARERHHEPERWVTKQLLAEHLHVTTRWIESQQQVGLPYLRLGASTATASLTLRRSCASDTEGAASAS